jgi:hypothetical protein
MRSSNAGQSWQDHRPRAQPDVHSLAWHPRARGRAYEAGGAGAAFSTDAGETWQPADEGRDRHYTWSVTVDPDDADHWYVSASTGPYVGHGRGDPQARIYRRRDREPWQPLTGDYRSPCLRCLTRSSPTTVASSPASPTGSSGRAATVARQLDADATRGRHARRRARSQPSHQRLRIGRLPPPAAFAESPATGSRLSASPSVRRPHVTYTLAPASLRREAF